MAAANAWMYDPPPHETEAGQNGTRRVESTPEAEEWARLVTGGGTWMSRRAGRDDDDTLAWIVVW